MVDKKENTRGYADLVKREGGKEAVKPEEPDQSSAPGPFAPTPSFAPPSMRALTDEMKRRIFAVEEDIGPSSQGGESGPQSQRSPFSQRQPPPSVRKPDLSSKFALPGRYRADTGSPGTGVSEPAPAARPASRALKSTPPGDAGLTSIQKIEKHLKVDLLNRDSEPDSQDMVEAVLQFSRLLHEFRKPVDESVVEEILLVLFEDSESEEIPFQDLYNRFKSKEIRRRLLWPDNYFEFLMKIIRLKKQIDTRDLKVLEIWEAFRAVVRKG